MCIDSHWGKGTTESHSQTSPPCHHSSPSHDSLISTLTILFHLGCLGANIASVKLGNKYDIFRLRYPAAYKERFKWKDLVIIFLLFSSISYFKIIIFLFRSKSKLVIFFWLETYLNFICFVHILIFKWS